ncbi:alpha/beta hydrolase [Larkinella rosea]|uniref:Alpha/beta hydrolase n=1 Tax=Larkinella rosea TaxID=2025312 RepID=A0A3P1BMI5_9BACT|nr:alpha/beta hydrolase [Larkinella rosea]RRB02262.1 alpha/beta hydrolase [Larkinella rosea]
MKKVFIFSGLGADERVFKYVTFSEFDVTFIHWICPEENETIEHYAGRLIEQIHVNRPILVGLSFGGIMATEVAKLIDTEKIILIASAKNRQEVPFYYRFAGYFNFHKFLPTRLLKRPTRISDWFFGVQTREDRRMLAAILRDTDDVFLKWAIDKIVNWRNTILHQNLKHIHGTADRILPIRFIHCDLKVTGGGHFMTVNKSIELTEKIAALLHESL